MADRPPDWRELVASLCILGIVAVAVLAILAWRFGWVWPWS